MVLVNINHSYNSIHDYHSSLEIIVMVFVSINHSYDSSHDSSPAVLIKVMVLVNGHDFYTHHKIMRMIKSSLTVIQL